MHLPVILTVNLHHWHEHSHALGVLQGWTWCAACVVALSWDIACCRSQHRVALFARQRPHLPPAAGTRHRVPPER